MSKLVLLLLLAIGTAQADTITLRHEVLARLQAADLTMDGNRNSGCAVMDVLDTVIVACYGDNRRAQYRQVMKALAGLNPVNKYSALLNSGHVEIR